MRETETGTMKDTHQAADTGIGGRAPTEDRLEKDTDIEKAALKEEHQTTDTKTEITAGRGEQQPGRTDIGNAALREDRPGDRPTHTKAERTNERKERPAPDPKTMCIDTKKDNEPTVTKHTVMRRQHQTEQKATTPQKAYQKEAQRRPATRKPQK